MAYYLLNKTGICAVICFVCFVPQSLHDLYFTWFGVAVFAACCFCAAGKNSLKGLFSARDWPLWLVVSSFAISAFFSVFKYQSLNRFVMFAGPMVFLFYAGKAISRKSGDTAFLIDCLTVCAGVAGLLGIYEAVFQYNPIYERVLYNPYYQRYIHGFVRPMSTFGNPAVLGSFMAGYLPAGLFALRNSDLFFRRAAGAVIVVSAVCLFLSLSRGAFLGAFFACFVYFYSTGRKRAAWIFCAVFVVISAAMSFTPYPINRLSPVGFTSMHSGAVSQYRTARAEISTRIFLDHVFTGAGPDNFRFLWNEYAGFGADIEKMVADNMFLTLLSETGLSGIASFILFLLILFRGKSRRDGARDGPAGYPAVFRSMAAGFAVCMFGYELLYWQSSLMFFSLSMGFLYGYSQKRIKLSDLA